MNALVKRSAALPDTRGEIGLPSVPTREALEYIQHAFVAKALNRYRAGRPPVGEDDEEALREAVVEVQEYVVTCFGFDPEDYPAAWLLMLRERREPWTPTPAELRGYLQRVHAGKPAAQLERVMKAHFGYWSFTTQQPRRPTWDEREHGPKPGQPGCRLTQQQQDRVWRGIFRSAKQARGILVSIQNPGEYRRSYGYLPCETGFELMEWISAQSAEGYDPLSSDCPIPGYILREFDVPTTARDLVAQKRAHEARVASWEARQLQRHAEYLAQRDGPNQAPPKPVAKKTWGSAGDLAAELLKELQGGVTHA